MSAYAKTDNGVAPIWEVVDTSSDYIPLGVCLGFFVGADGGTVSFDSKGQTVTPTFDANQFVTASLDKINASGTTATEISALVIPYRFDVSQMFEGGLNGAWFKIKV